MTRSTLPLALLLAASALAAAAPAGAGAGAQGAAPAYFEGPVWQDARLLLSFALGIACVHAAETLRGDRDGAAPGAPPPRCKHFQMYPYVL